MRNTDDDKSLSYYYYSDLDFKYDLQTCSVLCNRIIQCEHDIIFCHMFLDLTQ